MNSNDAHLSGSELCLAYLVVRFSTLLSLYSLYVNKMALPEVGKQRWRTTTKIHFKSPFPNSFLQNLWYENKFELYLERKHILIWKVSHEDLFWNRGKRDNIISGLLQTVLVLGVWSDRGWTFNLQRLCKFFFFCLACYEGCPISQGLYRQPWSWKSWWRNSLKRNERMCWSFG